MRRTVLTWAILPAITLPVLGQSSGLRQVKHDGAQQVVIDCRGGSVAMPHTFQLACADGNNYLSNLSWTSWRQGYASATGTQTINDCMPTCARGTFHSYPVAIVLWGSAPVAGHSTQRRYPTITLRYPGTPPPLYFGTTKMAGPPSVTSSLWNGPSPELGPPGPGPAS
jgi:hypothetical protein